ncbi:MAG TPA: hypothetical protein VEB64_12310 [Azospirillaceae bacterium]|nr:hypothetical protein [Azospirillaceae bacterium]
MQLFLQEEQINANLTGVQMSLKNTRLFIAALVTASAMSSAALADDFIAACKQSDPNPEAEKICTCASDKIAGADRAAAIAAMKAMTAALTEGKADANLAPDQMMALQAVLAAEAACMQ